MARSGLPGLQAGNAVMTPEKRIEMQICSYLKAFGYFFWKTDRQGTYDPIKKTFRANRNPYKLRGVSDILGILRGGRILAIEVKAPKGRVSPEQKLFIDLVNAAGGKASSHSSMVASTSASI